MRIWPPFPWGFHQSINHHHGGSMHPTETVAVIWFVVIAVLGAITMKSEEKEFAPEAIAARK
ncbi:MAG TPA: hypothetical protein VJH69_04000 [Candidatus Paceibacterota bacterium]